MRNGSRKFRVKLNSNRQIGVFSSIEDAIKARDASASYDEQKKIILFHRRKKAFETMEGLERELKTMADTKPDIYKHVTIVDGIPFCTLTGIRWHCTDKQNAWRCQVHISGKQQYIGRAEFWELDDLVEMRDKARGFTDEELRVKHKQMLDTLAFKGIPFCADAKDAINDVIYWTYNQRDPLQTPMRVKRSGVRWIQWCAHEMQQYLCRECNERAIENATNCNICAARITHRKRMRTKGGNGLCASCEQHLASEAEASGSAPPEKGKRWEDHVLDKLIPKVVDSEFGVPFQFEMRDSMSHMLGSSGKRRRGECDTTKQRRPDLLYLVREPERGRIVAALKIGVDEHSHDGYDPECESGKIDDQFQALQQLAAKEGASTGAAARFDAQMIYCTFLKANPNACDVTPAIKLDDRIEVLAKRCSDFLNTPAEEFQRRSAEGETNVPHVECLFYHSVQGKPIIDHFNAKADGAWDWRGNSFA